MSNEKKSEKRSDSLTGLFNPIMTSTKRQFMSKCTNFNRTILDISSVLTTVANPPGARYLASDCARNSLHSARCLFWSEPLTLPCLGIALHNPSFVIQANDLGIAEQRWYLLQFLLWFAEAWEKNGISWIINLVSRLGRSANMCKISGTVPVLVARHRVELFRSQIYPRPY